MDESSRRPRQVDGDGAAKRRRLRRLRSWWRHEQQTVAAVLATYQHHSAPRGPRTARTGRGARDELHGYAPEDAPPPRRLVPGTLRWTPGRTWVRHQPRGGQHRCLRCCRRNGYSSAPQSRSSTLCRWSIASCVCAAEGRTVGGHSRTSRFPCCRAGYRSTQDRVSTPRCSHSSPCSADGRPVGGSADDYLLFFVIAADYGTARLTFQFLLVVEGETQIFKVFSVDRVQQGRIRLCNAFLSRLWSRPLTFLFPLEALQLRTLQLLGSTLRMSRFNGFFALFPRKKKVQLSPGTWVRECPGTSAHPRPSAYGPHTWVDDDTGEVWMLLTDPALGSWWYSSRTRRSQWHPPWER